MLGQVRRPLPLWQSLAIGWSLALAGAAGSAQLGSKGSEPYAPAQLIVKLRGDVASLAPDALSDGFAARSGDPSTASLDELLDRQHVQRLRRVFRSREDGQGRLRRTTQQIVGQRLLERGLRGAELDAQLASVPELENVFLVTLEEGMGAAEAVAAFSLDPAVEWAEPNWIFHVAVEPLPAVPYVPDDRYVTLDGVHWSQGIFEGFPDLYGLRNSRAIEAWNRFDTDGSGSFEPGERRPGEGIVVAVIDSGVDASHPDLAANIWVAPGEIPGNGIDDDGNGFIDDVSGWDFAAGDNDPGDPHGHGTHVAGTVAALVGNGGVGVAGVGHSVRVLPIRGLDANGSGSAADLAAAVDYAVASGAHITSSSWGGPVPSQLLTDAFAAAQAAGVLNIAAAGNGTTDASGHSPSNLDSVMAVAAVDHRDIRASFSNFGDSVDISAPGVNVLSLNANRGDNVIARQRPGSVVAVDYLEIGGTSMATPHVSGAAAVLMSAFPAESAEEIRGRLMGGAQDIDASNPEFAGQLGAGRLDLLASLDAQPGPLLRLVDVHDEDFRPGQQARLSVSLRNFWLTASNVTAVLTTGEPDLTIDSGFVGLGDISTGETVENDAEPFLVTLAPDAPFGSFDFTLEVQADGGVSASFPLTLKSAFMTDVTEASNLPGSGVLPKFALFQDYSGDELPDVLFADLIGDTFIYENEGDGFFRRRNGRTGVDRDFNAFNSHFIDIDNDGDRDILLGGTNYFPTTLLLNQGDGTTVDISESAGMPVHAMPWSAAIDYNGDGLLDVLGGLGDGRVFEGELTDPMELLENQGDLTFVDRRAESGLPASPFPGQIGRILTLDYDDDGDPDVLFLGPGSPISLWRNEGDGTFSKTTGAAFGPLASRNLWGAAAGDCDNDGDIDLFASGVADSGVGPRNEIFLNDGGRFVAADPAAGELGSFAYLGLWWGVEFLDIDNDGDLDLYVPRDLATGGSELPVPEHSPLFENDGACGFSLINEVAFPSGSTSVGAAAAMADYDGDGDIDIYAPGAQITGSEGALLRNERGQQLHWLEIALVGTESARDAYGARVSVRTGQRRQIREVHTSPLDASMLHFGLGKARKARLVEVQWPSGIRGRYRRVQADQKLTLVEVDCGRDRDRDGDGVCNRVDNCRTVPNGDQLDTDSDGSGDACDIDFDENGRVDIRDVFTLLRALGSAVGDPAYVDEVDLDGNGVIDREDLALFHAYLDHRPHRRRGRHGR